jgi:hypothetical protein
MKTSSTSTRISHGILLGSLLLAGAGSAQAAVIYDNGPFVTHPGQGFGGADASAITVGLNTFGNGMNATVPVRLADNFTVAAGQTWNLTAIRFFGYQTGSTTTSTFTGLNAQIWNGRPGDPGAAVVWGNLADNILASAAFSGAYRVGDAAPYTGNTRPIMNLDATVSTSLNAGTYWLEWATTGSLASGPWNPPISIPGQLTTGDARQLSGGVWGDIVSGISPDFYQQGLPFQLQGDVTAVPEPGQWAMMSVTLLGAAGVALRRFRRQSSQ